MSLEKSPETLAPPNWNDSIPRLRCFACAPPEENPLGLNLRFEKVERGASTRFRVPEHFQSYPGYLHGGIVAAVLDETMAYAGVLQLARLPFTHTIQIEYRKAAPASDFNRCTAVLEEVGKATFSASAVLVDEKGEVCATATGRFFIPSYARAQKMMPGADLSAWKSFLGQKGN